jgi:hypothetical protein
MKKTLFFVSLIILVSCNSNQPTPAAEPAKPATDSAVAVAPTINSPYEIGYSSKFIMGNPKNAESILTLWKDYDNGNLSAHKEILADTFAAYLGGGAQLRAARDSAIGIIQKHRDALKAAVDRVDAVMAVRSTDKNEDWVLIWGTEIDTHKDGKMDSVNLQETWRINKDGKADLLFQFERPFPAKKK